MSTESLRQKSGLLHYVLRVQSRGGHARQPFIAFLQMPTSCSIQNAVRIEHTRVCSDSLFRRDQSSKAQAFLRIL